MMPDDLTPEEANAGVDQARRYLVKTEPNNWPKLIVACVVIVCMTVLIALDKVTESAGLALIGVTSGYILNNGLAAVQKRRAALDGR